MAKYYALISGLPNISVEDRKLPFSSKAFLEEINEVLSSSDKKLFNLVLQEEENIFLINYLTSSEEALNNATQPSLFSFEDVENLLKAIKEKKRLPKNNLPSYFISFLKEFVIEKEVNEDNDLDFNSEEEEEENAKEDIWPSRLDDKLAAFYYANILKTKNSFITEWSRLNLNIKNVFAAFTSKKLGWNPADYIVGNSSIEKKLKSSTSNISFEEDEMEYFQQLSLIYAEKNITKRERLLDILKWNWIEEQIFDKVFDVETLIAYYLKIRIIERWTDLNDKTGEETFRSIVANLKLQSNKSLNEFKKNQKK